MFPNPALTPGFEACLKSHHRVTNKVSIHNLNHEFISDASARLIDGTVDMDSTASVTRSGKVRLLDPFNDLGIGISGPSQFDRIIHIRQEYSSMDPANPGAWSAILGTCVITKVTRDGIIATVEFKGKEVLADKGFLRPYTWPAGWPRSAVIMNAMIIHAGEILYGDFSGGTQYLSSNWSVEAGDNLWDKLQELATSAGLRLYYRADGAMIIKPFEFNPVYSIDSSWLTDEPQQEYDMEGLANVVRVEGMMGWEYDGTPARMVYEAYADPSHPFSPQSLGRNGYPRYIPILIQDDKLDNFQMMAEVAWNTLQLALLQSNSVTATAAVMPWLEEFDVVNINHPRLYANVEIQKWSIPLVGDGDMSLNFHSSTTRGILTRANSISNEAKWTTLARGTGGRWQQDGIHHGPSGAMNSLIHKHHGARGHEIKYNEPETTSPHKGKKKNKNKNKGKGGK